MISFRTPRTISSYLVKAKLYPLKTIEDQGNPLKKCEVCGNNNSNNFTGSVTGEDYKINHRLNCDSKSLIYY